MAVEKITYVKRTIWEADCPTCEWSAMKTDNAPRETRCPECKTWVPYEKVEWTGPEIR